jgi:hypothetical protein
MIYCDRAEAEAVRASHFDNDSDRASLVPEAYRVLIQ